MSSTNDDEVRELVEGVQRSELSRREFVVAASAAGLSFAAIAAALSAAPAAASGANWAAKPGQSSAAIAVKEAKKYAGTTLNVAWESGLQAIEPKRFSGPWWEKLTGIKINVVELDFMPALYAKPLAEHVAKSGAYDVISTTPQWIPDHVLAGVIDDVGPQIQKHMNLADLRDFHPLYRALSTYKGKYYGLFDDGDAVILYYRKDIFEKLGLRVPQSWPELNRTAARITKELAPKVYGYGLWRASSNEVSFLQHFRVNGGTFFRPSDMKSLINSAAGVKTLTEMAGQTDTMPPGAKSWGAAESFSSWLSGKLAMTLFWPPLGRWSADYGRTKKGIPELSFVPKSQVKNVTGYALFPGGRSEVTGGYILGVGADSKNKDAAYLFTQWLTSPEVSLARVMLPYSLRDPYRLSHFTSQKYRSLWPTAGAYLDLVRRAADTGLVHPVMPGFADYTTALNEAATAAWSGTDPKKAMDEAAAKWDSVTKKLGVSAQRQAYREFLRYPGSTVPHSGPKVEAAYLASSRVTLR